MHALVRMLPALLERVLLLQFFQRSFTFHICLASTRELILGVCVAIGYHRRLLIIHQCEVGQVLSKRDHVYVVVVHDLLLRGWLGEGAG